MDVSFLPRTDVDFLPYTSVSREQDQSGRYDSGDISVEMFRRRLLAGVLRGEQEILRNVVSSSYVVVVLNIRIPCASDRCVCSRGICNSRVSLRYICVLSLLNAFSITVSFSLV